MPPLVPSCSGVERSALWGELTTYKPGGEFVGGGGAVCKPGLEAAEEGGSTVCWVGAMGSQEGGAIALPSSAA